MTKQYDIIHLNGEMYAVGKRIGTGNIYVMPKIPSIGKGYLQEAIETGLPGLYDTQFHPIETVASTDKSLGLPLLPKIEEDVWELGKQHAIGFMEDDAELLLKRQYSFMQGYKAASSKKYDENDLLRYMEARSKFYKEFIKKDIETGVYKTIEHPFEWLEERVHKAAIEFVSPKPIAVEIEMKYRNVPDQQQWQEMSKDQKDEHLVPKVDENNFVKVMRWIYG